MAGRLKGARQCFASGFGFGLFFQIFSGCKIPRSIPDPRNKWGPVSSLELVRSCQAGCFIPDTENTQMEKQSLRHAVEGAIQ